MLGCFIFLEKPKHNIIEAFERFWVERRGKNEEEKKSKIPNRLWPIAGERYCWELRRGNTFYEKEKIHWVCSFF